MSITIHFFRNRSLERIDYEKLIESEQKRVSSLSNAELKLKANFASQKRKKYYQIVSKERITKYFFWWIVIFHII